MQVAFDEGLSLEWSEANALPSGTMLQHKAGILALPLHTRIAARQVLRSLAHVMEDVGAPNTSKLKKQAITSSHTPVVWAPGNDQTRARTSAICSRIW